MGKKTGSNEKADIVGPVLEVLPVLLKQGRTKEVLAAFKKLVARNEELELRLAKLDQRRFKSNEGVSSAQLSLFLDALKKASDESDGGDDDAPPMAPIDEQLLAHAEAAAQAAAERAREKVLSGLDRPKRSRTKEPLPEHLPRVENPIDVPEDERACPQCGDEREAFDSEESEVLELEPAKLYVRVDKRIKRCCRACDGHIVRAPRGKKVVSGGLFGCKLIAKVLHDKFSNGLPLHRQSKNFGRLGMRIAPSTLGDQVKWAAELLRPLWLEAVDQVLDSYIMYIDGTGIRVLDRDHPKGKRTGTFWATVGGGADGPKVAAYHYASTKRATGQRPGELGPTDILALRSGIVVADADTLFAAQMKRDDITNCGCRVGGDVAAPAPHRSGRADFPHPVPHTEASLAAA